MDDDDNSLGNVLSQDHERKAPQMLLTPGVKEHRETLVTPDNQNRKLSIPQTEKRLTNRKKAAK